MSAFASPFQPAALSRSDRRARRYFHAVAHLSIGAAATGGIFTAMGFVHVASTQSLPAALADVPQNLVIGGLTGLILGANVAALTARRGAISAAALGGAIAWGLLAGLLFALVGVGVGLSIGGARFACLPVGLFGFAGLVLGICSAAGYAADHDAGTATGPASRHPMDAQVRRPRASRTARHQTSQTRQRAQRKSPVFHGKRGF